MHMRFVANCAFAITTLLSCAHSLPAVPAIATPANCDAFTSIAAVDVRGIDSAVKLLNASVTSYQGGLLAASPLLAGVANIHLVNRKAYLDAQVVCVTSAALSTKIVKIVEDTVGISIPSTVQNTIIKGPLLIQAGVTSELVASLELLQNDHDTYSAALLRSVDSSVIARADAVVLLNHDAIQAGIDYFSAAA